MNRYQIAIGKRSQRGYYKFKPTDSRATAYKYLRYCFDNNGDMDGRNIDDLALSSAVVKLSKEKGLPILMRDMTAAANIRISYGYRSVFDPTAVPRGSVICYGIDDEAIPPTVRARVRIMK